MCGCGCKRVLATQAVMRRRQSYFCGRCAGPGSTLGEVGELAHLEPLWYVCGVMCGMLQASVGDSGSDAAQTTKLVMKVRRHSGRTCVGWQTWIIHVRGNFCGVVIVALLVFGVMMWFHVRATADVQPITTPVPSLRSLPALLSFPPPALVATDTAWRRTHVRSSGTTTNPNAMVQFLQLTTPTDFRAAASWLSSCASSVQAVSCSWCK